MKRSVSKLNKQWHLAHRMPEKATLDQRIEWHLAHKQNCACRDIPEKLKQEIKNRGIKIKLAE